MNNKENNFISAVVYVHNAEKRISSFLDMLINTLEENFKNSEIICVNDCSDDNSVSLIRERAKTACTTGISIVNMSGFHGLESAMNAGVDLSIGDYVFEFDNTLPDYDPSEIMNIYHRALEGFDMVGASPKKREKLSSKLFYNAFYKHSGIGARLHTESFRILSRRLINRATSMNRSLPYRKALYAGAGLSTDTCFYDPIPVSGSAESARSRRYRRTLAIDSLILFTQLGYRFSICMTVLMMLVSIFMVIYSVVIYATAHPVEGWTTTILFLSVAFFGLFGILTVIIKYLQLLLNMIFKRKQYAFSGIEKVTK